MKTNFTMTSVFKNALLCLFLIFFGNRSFSQVSISTHNTDYNTNLSGWNGTLPSGFTRYATNGYVGTSSSTTGGVYAIPGAGFGYRPSSNSTATSCWLTATYQNNTGSAITSIQVSYQAFQITAASSRTPNWTVTSTLGNVSALTWSFNASATASSPDTKTAILAVNVPAGGTFTITFASDRGAGSGSSPLIGVNNIKVKSISSCTVPTNLAENNVTYEAADFIWDAQSGNSYEYVLDQNASDPSGAGTATAANTYSTNGLTPLTTYYFHVRTNCGGGTYSDWTMVNFTTPVAPCPETTGLSATNIAHESANLGWDAQGSNGFEYVLDQVATDPVGAGTATTAHAHAATGLSDATTYYFHVRTDCGNGSYSAWTTIDFTTTCPLPATVTASDISHESADLSWDLQGSNSFEYVLDQMATDPVTAGTATTATTFAATGLSASTTYNFHVRTDCGNGNYSPWITIGFTTTCPLPTAVTASDISHESANLSWDLQGSNSFEYVLDQAATDPVTAGTATTATTFAATGLSASTTYNFHVRTDCGNGNYSEWITIGFTTICPAPTGLTATNITHQSAAIGWGTQGGNTFEYVVNQTATDPTGAGTGTTGTTVSQAGLTPSTTYYLHVRTDCGGGNFSAWTTLSFMTSAAPCLAPAGLAATGVTSHTASVHWNAVSSSINYEYVVNQVSVDPLMPGTNTTATTIPLSGLTPSTTYFAHLRTNCGNGNYSPWIKVPFTTASDLGLEENQLLSVNVFPNPATTHVKIETQTQEGTVSLINVNGQLLRSIDLENTSVMELSDMAGGLYILLYEVNGTAVPLRLAVE